MATVALVPTSLDDIHTPPDSVDPDALHQLRDLFSQFPDLFSWSTDSLGRTHLVQHR
ncbi:unnamed protein product, partial [Dibothriocephalus latus]